jgi:hypothetical protein
MNTSRVYKPNELHPVEKVAAVLATPNHGNREPVLFVYTARLAEDEEDSADENLFLLLDPEMDIKAPSGSVTVKHAEDTNEANIVVSSEELKNKPGVLKLAILGIIESLEKNEIDINTHDLDLPEKTLRGLGGTAVKPDFINLKVAA